jgi:hypothetical protein
MDSKELEWIAEVVEKLQVPQHYNERQRLVKILERVAPAIIKTLDYTAMVGFSTYHTDDDGIDTLVKAGHTCNGCGQDHYFEEENPKHYSGGTRDNPDAKLPCRVEDLFQLLEEEERKEDK